MAIFSFGLLIIVGGYLALTDYYQNTVASRAVQLAARTAMNQIELTGNTASWMAYNGSALCMSTPNGGKIFYLNGANQLMEDVWISTTACNSTGSGSPVTSSDVKISALIPEQVDNYSIASSAGATPCVPPGNCAPPAPTSHKSMRVTVRATSDSADLNAAGTACLPNAPATCVVSTLSTTVTAGEF